MDTIKKESDFCKAMRGKMSQEEFAELLDVPIRAVRDWEYIAKSTHRSMPLRHAIKIMEMKGII